MPLRLSGTNWIKTLDLAKVRCLRHEKTAALPRKIPGPTDISTTLQTPKGQNAWHTQMPQAPWHAASSAGTCTCTLVATVPFSEFSTEKVTWLPALIAPHGLSRRCPNPPNPSGEGLMGIALSARSCRGSCLGRCILQIPSLGLPSERATLPTNPHKPCLTEGLGLCWQGSLVRVVGLDRASLHAAHWGLYLHQLGCPNLEPNILPALTSGGEKKMAAGSKAQQASAAHCTAP